MKSWKVMLYWFWHSVHCCSCHTGHFFFEEDTNYMLMFEKNASDNANSSWLASTGCDAWIALWQNDMNSSGTLPSLLNLIFLKGSSISAQAYLGYLVSASSHDEVLVHLRKTVWTFCRSLIDWQSAAISFRDDFLSANSSNIWVTVVNGSPRRHLKFPPFKSSVDFATTALFVQGTFWSLRSPFWTEWKICCRCTNASRGKEARKNIIESSNDSI